MKLFGKLLIAVLIIGFLLPFTILKGKDGKSLMSFSDIKFPSFSNPLDIDVPGFDDLKDLSKPASASNLIYKWTDDEGNLQFSSSKPEESIEYTVKGYDSNQNVIQSVKIEPKPVETVVDSEAEKKTANTNDIGSPYSVEKVEKLFKDAEGIEKLLNDRLKNQEAIIGQ
ncbi:MAG: hypothetical protein ACI9KN_002035 [Gammaproteobacteria bacterium]|jgi:hypothetical protein